MITGMSKPVSPEVEYQRTSAAAKERWANPEIRARTIEGIKKGRGMRPEVLAALRERIRRQWADPEWVAKHHAAQMAGLARPEVRAKISAAQRRVWATKSRVRRARGPFVADGLPIRCECCGHPFTKTRRPELDHRVSIALGGSDDSSNANWLCAECHSFKTGTEFRVLSALRNAGR